MGRRLKVHLYGGYNVIRAAWPHFREQSYGRVVVATSTSGLFGNFGQTNYGAAKLGLVGLINCLALEGAKYNIHVNALAPIAATRMTEDILPHGGAGEAHARVRRSGGGLPVHRGIPQHRFGFRRRRWKGAAGRAVSERRRHLRQAADRWTMSPRTGPRSPTCPRRKKPTSSCRGPGELDEQFIAQTVHVGFGDARVAQVGVQRAEFLVDRSARGVQVLRADAETPSDSRASVNVSTSGVSSVSERCWIISVMRSRSWATASLLRR